jgi:16S rRNA (cytidine1402-2'-O)-methyltransferase
MNGQVFAFHGYLPAKPPARVAALRSLDHAVTRTGATQLFIETPYRNDAMIEAVLEACSPVTRFCVAADLTLPSELILCRPIAAWHNARPALAKRPAMFLLGRD